MISGWPAKSGGDLESTRTLLNLYRSENRFSIN